MTEDFPIVEIIPAVKEKLLTSNVVIVQAAPGAGKSTILPLELLKDPRFSSKKILLLEPRRLAARSVATRMASLLNESVGETIGFRIRFENKISNKTKLEVVTEGILTRMLQHDNALEEYGIIIFDEFHERSLHADLALALTRESQQVIREDLKIIIMSATIESQELSLLLDNAPVLKSTGRQYPIKYVYKPEDKDLSLPIQMCKVIRQALANEEGDVLAFLPGSGEILRTAELLEKETTNCSIHPLYGDLPFAKQQEALIPNPFGIRKIVLASSIAETSLTIEGIKIVVDSGYARVPKFDIKSGLTKLETLRVTKDTADQRAGRAGRLGPGICYRLWNENTNQYLQTQRTPEILEADLAPSLLELYNWGIKDTNSLTWITPPPSTSITLAKELLIQLGAIKLDTLTTKGKEMLQLPTHPRISHLLLEGKEFNLLALACDVAAVLEERDPAPKNEGANLAIRIELLRKFRNKEYVNAEKNTLDRIERISTSWHKQFSCTKEIGLPLYEQVGKLVAAAYPERIAKKQPGSKLIYRLANGKSALLSDQDPMQHEEWLSIAHLEGGKNEGKIYLAAPLNKKDILHLSYSKPNLTWDYQKGIFIAQNEKKIGGITIETTPLEVVAPEEKAAILIEVVKKEGAVLFNWTENLQQWQARILFASKWNSSEDWPQVATDHLLLHPEDWLTPYLTTIRKKEDFYKLDLEEILSSMLSWEMNQQLERIAPEKIKVPSGFEIKLQYSSDGKPPILAVRLQEMFGLLETPTINQGKTKVMLHLLSPGYKPVQVTQDLKSFWQNTYPEVRKELRVRYQKHFWPEDPWTSEAMRGTKKQNNQ